MLLLVVILVVLVHVLVVLVYVYTDITVDQVPTEALFKSFLWAAANWQTYDAAKRCETKKCGFNSISGQQLRNPEFEHCWLGHV